MKFNWGVIRKAGKAVKVASCYRRQHCRHFPFRQKQKGFPTDKKYHVPLRAGKAQHWCSHPERYPERAALWKGSSDLAVYLLDPGTRKGVMFCVKSKLM